MIAKNVFAQNRLFGSNEVPDDEEEWMSHKSKVPGPVRKYFELKPIIVGEDEKAYDELRDSLIAALGPRSIEAWLLAKDLIDTEWELQRQRRMKADIVTAAMPHAFAKQLSQEDRALPGNCDVDHIDSNTEQLRALLNGLKPVRPDVLQKLLAAEGLTVSAVAAKAFAATAPTQQHLERMATSASKRRSAISAELQRMKQRQENSRSQEPRHRAQLLEVDASGASIAPKQGDAQVKASRAGAP